MRSDIFDEYVKIATQQGLVKQSKDEEETVSSDAPKESAKLKRYKKSPHPRAGSDDISTIEALYGVKPDNPIKYEYNIMEAAHPKPVVIGPISYDRLNGLVENNIERQNIISNIALKPNNGNLTQHRYADKDLMMQLVRIANDMDNKGFEEIRKIADECISELALKKKLNKVAILPWIIGASVVLAGVWLWNHINDPDKGLINNLNLAIKKLDDLKTNSWYESGVDQTTQENVEYLENKLVNLKSSIDNFNSIMNDIEKPKTLSDMQAASTNSNQVKDQLDAFIKAVDDVLPAIAMSIKNFTDTEYQNEHTNQGLLSSMTSWIGEGLHGRWGLFANEFISAAEALEPLMVSLKDAKNKAMNIEQVKDTYQQDIANMLNPPQKNEIQQENTSPSGNTNINDKKDEYPDIFKMIGYTPDDREKAFFNATKI